MDESETPLFNLTLRQKQQAMWEYGGHYFRTLLANNCNSKSDYWMGLAFESDDERVSCWILWESTILLNSVSDWTKWVLILAVYSPILSNMNLIQWILSRLDQRSDYNDSFHVGILSSNFCRRPTALILLTFASANSGRLKRRCVTWLVNAVS